MSERKEKIYECTVDGKNMNLAAKEAYFLRVFMGQNVKLHLPAISERPMGEEEFDFSDEEEQMFIQVCGGHD